MLARLLYKPNRGLIENWYLDSENIFISGQSTLIEFRTWQDWFFKKWSVKENSRSNISMTSFELV